MDKSTSPGSRIGVALVLAFTGSATRAFPPEVTNLSAILKSDQDPAILGTPISYTLFAVNASPVPAQNVAFSLTLPDQTTFIATTVGTHNGSSTGGVVMGLFNLVPAASSSSVIVQAQMGTSPVNSVTALGTVTVTSPGQTDPNPSNNSATHTIGVVQDAGLFPVALFVRDSLETLTGHTYPNSRPPGVSERFNFFDRPCASPNGEHVVIRAFVNSGSNANNEVIIHVGPGGSTTAVREGVTVLPGAGDAVGIIDFKLSVNDSGLYSFSTNTDAPTTSDQVVVIGTGSNLPGGTGNLTVVAREGQPVAGMTGVSLGASLRETQLQTDGSLWFIATLTGSIDAATNEAVFRSQIGGTPWNVMVQKGVTIPSNQSGGLSETWQAFDNELTWRSGLSITPDGDHYLLRGDLNGASTGDDVLVRDNAVVLQEGVIANHSFSLPTQPHEPVAISILDPNGNYFAMGANADGQQWMLRNGAIIALAGNPIYPGSSVNWREVDSFRTLAAGSGGRYVIGGSTNSSQQGILVGFDNHSAFIISKAGDPVDADGNGKFDDGTFVHSFGTQAALVAGNRVLIPLNVILPAISSSTSSTVAVLAYVATNRPRGACCLPLGNCVDNIEASYCNSAGGIYQGNDIPCTSTICPEPTGACCYNDGACLDSILQSNCVLGENQWHFNQTCVQVNCVVPQCPTIPGDMNGDNMLNGIDILGFVSAALGAVGGQTACADMNHDNAMNNVDTLLFAQVLVQ